MSSIALIIRADQPIEAFPSDWVPQSLGCRDEVLAAIERCVPHDPSLALILRVEDVEESAEPRTISVSGVWGARECEVLKKLCEELAARFYDAEAGDFIDL
jgi:hypothetical protein